MFSYFLIRNCSRECALQGMADQKEPCEHEERASHWRMSPRCGASAKENIQLVAENTAWREICAAKRWRSPRKQTNPSEHVMWTALTAARQTIFWRCGHKLLPRLYEHSMLRTRLKTRLHSVSATVAMRTIDHSSTCPQRVVLDACVVKRYQKMGTSELAVQADCRQSLERMTSIDVARHNKDIKKVPLGAHHWKIIMYYDYDPWRNSQLPCPCIERYLKCSRIFHSFRP